MHHKFKMIRFSINSYVIPSTVCSDPVELSPAVPHRKFNFQRKYTGLYGVSNVNGPPLILGHPLFFFLMHRSNGLRRSVPIVHVTI